MIQIKPNKEKALMLAKRSLSSLVCDAVNLEGILYTLPEVQTLLDGVTVGGHSLQDQEITLNQSNAWKKIFKDIQSNQFIFNKQYLLDLHAIAAKNEALESGCFRSGMVTIAGTNYLPPKANDLDHLFTEMVASFYQKTNILEAAIFIFLEMARNQFFYDVNKRMGRFIMNALLLSKGYPVINVPAIKQLEFNEKMLRFYETHHHDEMTLFMVNCLDETTLTIMSET